MENVSAQTLYQLCAAVDGERKVSPPLGWLQIWGHLPPEGQKLSGNYAACYQKWIEIVIVPIGPIFVPIPVYALAIQGTKDAMEILEDFEVAHQVPFPPVPNAYISKGSSDALDDVLQLQDDKTGVALQEFLPTLPENAYLVVTGHSLGGNLASVMGPWIGANVPNYASRNPPELPLNLRVVTFAAPTAGDQVFAQYLNRQETYQAHFNLNDVVPNMWAETGELSIANVRKLFPAPELTPAPPAVQALLDTMQRMMAQNKVSYAQTRGERFAYPCATPPEDKTGELERWLWELNYQHNDAYNAMFLPPEGGTQEETGLAPASDPGSYRVELVVNNNTGGTIECTDTSCELFDVPGFQLGIGATIPNGETGTYRSTTNNRIFATFAPAGSGSPVWQMGMTCPKASHNSADGNSNAGLQTYSRTGTPVTFTYNPGQPNQADWNHGNENEGDTVTYGDC
ncbi:MAG TPA: lipase family protein [Thermoanaerobaculia bacterium]|jgi:hypothetical protein|nr:lipase family protein [Thermoanaerobaculia bacterium]